MKFFFHIKKTSAFLCSFVSIAFISNALVVYAADPAITSIDRPFSDSLQHGAYYAQGWGVGVQVETINGATYVNSNWKGSWRCDLGITSISNGVATWNSAWVPSSSDYVPGTFPYANTPYYNKNTYSMERTGNSSCSTTAQELGYVTISALSFYRSWTTRDTFYYNNELDHNFYGIGTGYSAASDSTYGTYNCLGYAIDTCNYWQWPWDRQSYAPTDTQIINFMNGTDSGPDNNDGTRTWGTLYKNYSFSDSMFANAIYYDGGHFAKVISWDSSGYPTAIMSKWGTGELIRSNGYNPFGYRSDGSGYGNARIFFRY